MRVKLRRFIALLTIGAAVAASGATVAAAQSMPGCEPTSEFVPAALAKADNCPSPGRGNTTTTTTTQPGSTPTTAATTTTGDVGVLPTVTEQPPATPTTDGTGVAGAGGQRPRGALSRTGSDPTGQLLLAAGLIGAGTLVALAARHRRRAFI